MSRGQQQQDREAKASRAALRQIQKLGEKIHTLDRLIQETPDQQHYINQVVLRVRYGLQGDILGIVKADTDDGKQLAFHSDDTVAEVLNGLVNRLVNGSLKWQEDKPYDQRAD